jgi:hypothetical protein
VLCYYFFVFSSATRLRRFYRSTAKATRARSSSPSRPCCDTLAALDWLIPAITHPQDDKVSISGKGGVRKMHRIRLLYFQSDGSSKSSSQVSRQAGRQQHLTKAAVVFRSTSRLCVVVPIPTDSHAQSSGATGTVSQFGKSSRDQEQSRQQQVMTAAFSVQLICSSSLCVASTHPH